MPTAAQVPANRARPATSSALSASDAEVVVDLRNLKEISSSPMFSSAKRHLDQPLPRISVGQPKNSQSGKKNLMIGVIAAAAAVAVGVIVIGSVLLILSLPALQAARGALSGRWITYRSPEQGYTVSFPRQPQLASDSTLSKVTCDLGASGSYHVATNEIQFTGLNPEKLLDESMRRGKSALNAQLISEKEIELEGNPGREFAFTGTRNGMTFKASGRVYIVGKKMYQLLYFHPTGLGSDADTQKFFDSFKLPHN